MFDVQLQGLFDPYLYVCQLIKYNKLWDVENLVVENLPIGVAVHKVSYDGVVDDAVELYFHWVDTVVGPIRPWRHEPKLLVTKLQPWSTILLFLILFGIKRRQMNY